MIEQTSCRLFPNKFIFHSCQSYFARFSLQRILADCGLQHDEGSSLLERIFKEVWANNGDYVSRQYAGTSALKGDFTRTGKRDMNGVLKDGINSVNRYYINNFQDEDRQVIKEPSPINPKLDNN